MQCYVISWKRNLENIIFRDVSQNNKQVTPLNKKIIGTCITTF